MVIPVILMVSCSCLDIGMMEALLEGRLVEEGDCLRVESVGSSSNTSYVLILLDRFSIGTDGGKTVLLDRENNIVASVGDIVEVGGGEANEASLSWRRFFGQLPKDCEGPYWIVGTISRIE